MAKAKRKDWVAEFKRLLAPKILQALKEDRAGRIPLRAPQRRACRTILLLAMSEAEIRAAVAPSRGRASRRAKASRQGRRRRKA